MKGTVQRKEGREVGRKQRRNKERRHKMREKEVEE